MEIWDTIKDLIANLGFPIFIASFFVIKIQKILEMLNDTISDLKKVVEQNSETMQKLSEKVNMNYELTKTLVSVHLKGGEK